MLRVWRFVLLNHYFEINCSLSTQGAHVQAQGRVAKNLMNRSHVTIKVLNLDACLQRADIIITVMGQPKCYFL